MKNYFVTGIGTDMGKTIVAAILTEALKADYWKPVQAGDLHLTDTMKVAAMISNSKSFFHPERFQLTQPMSPHAAAAMDNIKINASDFILPTTNNRLIVEGAGGIMVPINEKEMVIDIIKKLSLEVILVVKNYLGSINHSILSIETLRSHKIPVKGIIFNGERNEASERFILNYAPTPSLGFIPQLPDLTPNTIAKIAQQFHHL